MKLITTKNFLSLVMIIFSFSYCEVSSQTLTKITTGEFVNDGGESFGISWADFNNDGYPDLLVSNGGAAAVDVPNFLYFNNGDGTFSKINIGQIVTSSERSIGSTIADFNNDGYADVFITNRDGQNNSLFLNNGDSTFSRITTGSIVQDGGNSNGSAWADYNNDGFVDLFVANFFEQGFLYKNQDGNIFNSIITGYPVSETNTSISCAWGDYDNDGDTDLFVPNAAAAGKANFLYNNNGDGTFSKVSTGSIVTDLRASMGGTWGDYDNDGDLDLFVANQGNFVNDLYINSNGTFTSLDSGEVVSEQSNSISGSWIDYDNDGDLDLFVTNWQNEKNFLYENSGFPDYLLTKIQSGEIVNDQENTMGGAWGDYDNDGDLDLFIANRGNQNNSFYRNDNPSNQWINIKCEGVVVNRSAIGTKVKIKATINGNSFWQMREINSQFGYNSQNDPRVHFGLGDAQSIDSLVIEWSSSSTEVFTNIQPNNFYNAVQGTGISLITSVYENFPKNPEGFYLFQNYPNPFNPTTKIEFQIASPGFVSLKIFDITGKEIAALINGSQSAGNHKIEFNGESLSTGIYFYQLKIDNYIETKKMTLLK
ncbi:MAG: VCBS repeat-containing protein [Ignavibacteriales bacterium]|nr:MAG: VCBS repeat-containing protein [Ignavibacteriales bacterium]